MDTHQLHSSKFSDEVAKMGDECGEATVQQLLMDCTVVNYSFSYTFISNWSIHVLKLLVATKHRNESHLNEVGSVIIDLLDTEHMIHQSNIKIV